MQQKSVKLMGTLEILECYLISNKDYKKEAYIGLVENHFRKFERFSNLKIAADSAKDLIIKSASSRDSALSTINYLILQESLSLK